MQQKIRTFFIIILLYLFLIILFSSLAACSFKSSNSNNSTIQQSEAYNSEVSNDEGNEESKAQDTDRAKQILNQMTIKDKIGQLFLVRCFPERAVDDIKALGIGGIVLFASDFNKSADEVITDINRYKNAANFGLLVAVDEEGGSVVRVSRYTQFRSKPFLSPLDIYKNGGLAMIEQNTLEKAKLLLSLGININLAPVCDLTTKKSSFIYQRSVGTDAVIGSDIVEIIVKTSENAGLGTTLKHFPGYGDNADTHIGFSFDDRSLDSLLQRDLLPFKAGIASGSNAVMVSHITLTSIDKENPASLSEAVHRILREQLNFDGVIITDDLSMDAVNDYIDISEVGVKAVLAGNDIICTSDYIALYDSIYNAVQNGTITMQRLDESVLRILNWKLKLKIIY